MGKVNNIYGGFTSSEIKSRATFPPQGNIIDNTTYLDCVNLEFSDLKSTLSESHYNLSLLNKSNNVNQYSYFQGGYWQYTGSTINYHKDIAPFNIGSMALYNHNAVAPSKSNYQTEANIIYEGYSDVIVTANIDVDEIDWTSVLYTNIDAIEMVVKQGASIKGTESIAYSDTTQQSGFNFSKTVTMSGAGTLTVYFYFNEEGSNVAPIPNISTHNISVSVLYPATFGTVELSSALQSSYPTWELIYNEGTSNIDQANEEYTFYDFAIDNDSDGEGDVTRFNMELFAKLNDDKSWYSVQSGINITSSGINIIDDSLPFSVDYGDIINFELRDG